MNRVVRSRWGLLAGIVVGAAALVLVSAGCPAEQTGAGLQLGEAVMIASGTAGPEGGTITVGDASSAVAGLTITVPAGALGASTSFAISQRPITGHGMGAMLNPLTPLITIENGGGYANAPVEVRIPVAKAADRFAMAFFYDQQTGQLEGLPVAGWDDTSITVATRHFSDILVSDVAVDLLLGDVTTDFRVGVDNWQIENPGTYLVAGGSCSGMSLTSLFYFDVLKREYGPLFGLLDYNTDPNPSTPDLIVDDVLAIRLCATAQAEEGVETEQEYDTWFDEGLEKADLYGFYMCAYSMLVSGKPQYIAVLTADRSVGHALVVYGKSGTRLFVADPNRPKDGGKYIEMDMESGAMQTYETSLSSGSPPVDMTELIYVGKTAIVSWDKLSEYWGKTLAGTIGEDFPDYTLKIIEPVATGGAKESVLDATFETSAAQVNIRVDGPFTSQVTAYKQGQNEPASATAGTIIVPLELGANVLGFRVDAEREWQTDPNSPAVKAWGWTDFRWVTVTRGDGGSGTTTACTPDSPSDRWLVVYDYDCDGTIDSDALWHFLSDGTISHHWLGPISGYTWTMEGQNVVVSFGDGKNGMRATMSSECRMVDGVFVGDFVSPTCWTAARQ